MTKVKLKDATKELLKGDSRRQGQQQTTNANFGSAGNMFSTFR